MIGWMRLGRTTRVSLALLLAACAQEDAADEAPAHLEPPAATDTVGGAGPVLERSVAQSRLERAAPDTGAIGTARLLESDDVGGTLALIIEVNSLPAGRHAWEVHGGICSPTSGSDEPLAAGEIQVGQSGFGEASAMLSLRAGAAYSVVLRTAADDVVACATL